MTTEFWNLRYSQEAYAYGQEPNHYLKAQLAKIPAGKILFPAEGEGRNAVYAARMGWEVSAFDLSAEGKRKAEQLAALHQVNIQYQVGDLGDLVLPVNTFDAIALIYAHFPAPVKSAYHKHLTTCLKPGGWVLFEAFSKNHLAYNQKNEQVGGPRDIDTLFSLEEIEQDFTGFDILELEEKVVELKEGLYHNGTGSVIRFLGRKR